MHANHLIWGKEITLPETCFLLLLYKASNAKKKKKNRGKHSIWKNKNA